MIVQEVERMLAEVGLKPSPFAKEAGLLPSTLTRFLKNDDAPLLSTTTLMKLRQARDRLLAARGAGSLDLEQFAKNPRKRAMLAMLVKAGEDDLAAIENAIKSIPKRKSS
jgi:predicted transcriptional regulator